MATKLEKYRDTSRAFWPGRKKHKPQLARTSNHYLVYVIHWMDVERIQIISIMSPDAHEKAKSSFLAVLERRAEAFHNS